MADLKTTPQNEYLATIARALRSARDFGDRAELPVVGGLGSLFLGQSPEEVEEWSYGNAPMQMTPMGVRLPQMKRGRGAQLADTLFAAADVPALRSLTAAAGKPLAAALERSPLHDAARFIQEQRTPVSAVVKPKGGNWLTGSVEDALKGLKKRLDPELEGYARRGQNLMPHEAAEVLPGVALNNWIEGPLTKYVKTRMASPDDEVRKLAEQGVLHTNQLPDIYPKELVRIQAARESAGFPKESSSRWEDLADIFARGQPVDEVKRGWFMPPDYAAKIMRENPWLGTAPETTTVYGTNMRGVNVAEDLGFPHLIDELSNALDPASGLPRNLQLTPKAVENMSMEKAVRLVSDINAWRAAQKIEANRKLAEQAALVREYAENNPKGLRWVELKAPDEPSPEQLRANVESLVRARAKQEGWSQDRIDEAIEDPQAFFSPEEIYGANAPRDVLEKQLRYEGDTMGHCVGGYCDDVLSGRSRIFSLRDAKGEPHVTIEARPPRDVYPVSGEAFAILPQETKDRYRAIVADWRKRNPEDPDVWKALAEAGIEPSPPSIFQIKGKQNRAPNEEYLPFVQDFVRNSPLGSPWSEVGDLSNTGLTKHPTGKYVSDAEANALAQRHFGNVWMGNKPDDIENPWQYANRIRRYDPDMLSDTDKAFLADWEAGNFASGGSVQAQLPAWPDVHYNWDILTEGE